MTEDRYVVNIGCHGRVLGTRRLGRELADVIRDTAAKAAGSGVIDFKGVEVATSTVLDEIMHAVRAARAAYPGRSVSLANLNEDVRETLRVMESWHDGGPR